MDLVGKMLTFAAWLVEKAADRWEKDGDGENALKARTQADRLRAMAQNR